MWLVVNILLNQLWYKFLDDSFRKDLRQGKMSNVTCNSL